MAAFLRQQRVQRIIVTIAPMFVGGQPALDISLSGKRGHDSEPQSAFPRLDNVQQRWYGDDLVLEGDPVWPSAE
jgi:3,4-dihydroxy 2-butanone 4-phosphate synthase/GTP cyclohydrolase II